MQPRQSAESAQEPGARSGSHGYDHRESEGGNKVSVGVTTSPPAFASAPNTNPILKSADGTFVLDAADSVWFRRPYTFDFQIGDPTQAAVANDDLITIDPRRRCLC